MEKYEINKYLNIFKTKIDDLRQATKIDDLKKTNEELQEKINSLDFWNDQKLAKDTIEKANNLKNIIISFELIERKYNDILTFFNQSTTSDELEMIDDEIINLKKLIENIEIDFLLSNEYDNLDAIIDIHPGAGGVESMDFALIMYRMYQKYLLKKGFKITILNLINGDEAGLKSVSMLVKGKNAYGLLESERGVHRFVRISPFDSSKKRHTSFVSIDVTPSIKDDTIINIKPDDIKVDVFHSSGAGGQSVNTTDSAVRITHLKTNIVVTCQNERSQHQNKETAMLILKSKLFELKKQEQKSSIKNLKGDFNNISFGHQIRSYVFCPYTLVKDYRSEYETSLIFDVLDGNLDEFILKYLKYRKLNNNDIFSK